MKTRRQFIALGGLAVASATLGLLGFNRNKNEIDSDYVQFYDGYPLLRTAGIIESFSTEELGIQLEHPTHPYIKVPSLSFPVSYMLIKDSQNKRHNLFAPANINKRVGEFMDISFIEDTEITEEEIFRRFLKEIFGDYYINYDNKAGEHGSLKIKEWKLISSGKKFYSDGYVPVQLAADFTPPRLDLRISKQSILEYHLE